MHIGSESLKEFEEFFQINVTDFLDSSPEHKINKDNTWRGVYLLNDNELHFYVDEVKSDSKSKEILKFFVRFDLESEVVNYFNYEDFILGDTNLSEIKNEFINYSF